MAFYPGLQYVVEAREVVLRAALRGAPWSGVRAARTLQGARRVGAPSGEEGVLGVVVFPFGVAARQQDAVRRQPCVDRGQRQRVGVDDYSRSAARACTSAWNAGSAMFSALLSINAMRDAGMAANSTQRSVVGDTSSWGAARGYGSDIAFFQHAPLESFGGPLIPPKRM